MIGSPRKVGVKGGVMGKWKKLPQIQVKDLHIGRLNCSTATLKAPMDMGIAVGFGAAYATKDGKIIYDGERDYQDTGKCKTIGDIEEMAKQDPDHDWRISKHCPMHGEVFQRHGDNEWVCIESDEGFA